MILAFKPLIVPSTFYSATTVVNSTGINYLASDYKKEKFTNCTVPLIAEHLLTCPHCVLNENIYHWKLTTYNVLQLRLDRQIINDFTLIYKSYLYLQKTQLPFK